MVKSIILTHWCEQIEVMINAIPMTYYDKEHLSQLENLLTKLDFLKEELEKKVRLLSEKKD